MQSMTLLDVVNDERTNHLDNLFCCKGWNDAAHDGRNFPPLVWIVDTPYDLGQRLTLQMLGDIPERIVKVMTC